MGFFSSLRVGEQPRGVLGSWAERVGKKASCGATATGVCDTSLQVAHGLLLQRYTKVVLALCPVLLVLWHCF